MNIEQIIEFIGQIATWVTVLLVFLTLREMEKQRKSSQKPEIIVPNISLFGYGHEQDGIYLATHWSNEKLNNEYVVEKLPKVIFYNIGSGAAKSIRIKWDFNLQSTVETIQDYCYKHSLPIIVNNENNKFLKIDLKDNSYFMNIENILNIEQPYLLPASTTNNGLEIDLPSPFLRLSSILGFLNLHQNKQKSEKYSPGDSFSFQFEMPELILELEYYDVGGNKYKKIFDMKYEIIALPYRLKKGESTMLEPAFHGYFNIKERK